MIPKIFGGKLSFAHLASVTGKKPSAKSKAEEEEREEGEEREEKRDEGNKGKKSKGKADDSGESEDAESEEEKEEEEEDDGTGKGKKSKGKGNAEDDKDEEYAEDEDDDKEEMNGKGAASRARRRERARCAAIFAHKSAAANYPLAASLAFETTMTRSEAIAVLSKAPAARNGASEARSARNPSLGPGSNPELNTAQAISNRWDRAFGKASPTRGR